MCRPERPHPTRSSSQPIQKEWSRTDASARRRATACRSRPGRHHGRLGHRLQVLHDRVWDRELRPGAPRVPQHRGRLSAYRAVGAGRHCGRAGPSERGSLVVMTAVGTAGVVTMAIALTPDPSPCRSWSWWACCGRCSRTAAGRFRPAVRARRFLSSCWLPPSRSRPTRSTRQASSAPTTSEHAAFFHWVETAFYAVAIVFLGVLAGLRPSAFRLAAWCGAVGAIILGAGSLAFPTLASAVPMPWGWVAVAGGLAFLAMFELGRGARAQLEIALRHPPRDSCDRLRRLAQLADVSDRDGSPRHCRACR